MIFSTCPSCGARITLERRRVGGPPTETLQDTRDLRDRMHHYVKTYGPSAVGYFARASAWFADDKQRSVLLNVSKHDHGLLEALEIVVLVGRDAAGYLPLLAQKMLAFPHVDTRV